MEESTQEHRHAARHRALKGARIVFKGRAATIDCVVRNLSDRGACLNMESPIGIPDSFDLVLDDASVRHCRVTWRKATQIGVEFG
ncbi:MAG: PilZ domain-containing protein [Methylocella sp.]|nr:MAG: pilus assembly protein PilZ [Hyphomicrobiales bacterium]